MGDNLPFGPIDYDPTQKRYEVRGVKDTGSKPVCWLFGSNTTRATVYAEVGRTPGIGSLYFTATGKIYIKVADAGASTDWQRVTSSAAD